MISDKTKSLIRKRLAELDSSIRSAKRRLVLIRKDRNRVVAEIDKLEAAQQELKNDLPSDN